MIPKSELTYEELKYMARAFLELWERDDTYMFYIMDLKNDQIVGVVFLNRMNCMHQFTNLGYAVRTSCINQGFATAAAKLVARYGFEKLDLQRIADAWQFMRCIHAFPHSGRPVHIERDYICRN